MKLVRFEHPEQTYPELIEAACEKLSAEWRLHSTRYLPGQVLGNGTLILFFEERPKFKLHEFKARESK